MILVGLIFLGFTLAVLISYFVMYSQASKDLNNDIDEVLKHELPAGQAK